MDGINKKKHEYQVLFDSGAIVTVSAKNWREAKILAQADQIEREKDYKTVGVIHACCVD